MISKNKTLKRSDKKYLVLWSGGLDSTYLIYSILSNGHSVDAVYININNNFQDDRQLKAVTKLADLFRQQFPNQFFVHNTEGSHSTGQIENIFNLRQISFHIFHIMRHVREEHSRVAIGYVCGDDAISFLKDIRKIYYSYNGITDPKLPKLIFPLYKTTKKHILDNLPSMYFEHTTWCDGAGVDPMDRCGHCKPCMKMKTIAPYLFNIGENATIDDQSLKVEQSNVKHHNQNLETNEPEFKQQFKLIHENFWLSLLATLSSNNEISEISGFKINDAKIIKYKQNFEQFIKSELTMLMAELLEDICTTAISVHLMVLSDSSAKPMNFNYRLNRQLIDKYNLGYKFKDYFEKKVVEYFTGIRNDIYQNRMTDLKNIILFSRYDLVEYNNRLMKISTTKNIDIQNYCV